MAVVPITKIPHKVLTTKAEKVLDFGPETQEIIQNLLDTLNHAKNPEGAGLAAPQIGVSKKICIVRRFFSAPSTRSGTLIEDLVLINPKIISQSKETELDWEGCLSIPNTYGQVERSKRIKIKASDRDGNEFKLSASGFFARVIQHEMDHLDGVLFTTKLSGPILTEKEIDKLFSQKVK